jgi:glutathione synthase/RimK-type ligase-like ATP-grasp enzyme
MGILPSATRMANRKPVQLQTALTIGLRIPHSCIGNSWVAAKSFFDEMGSRPVIMKPVGSAFARLNHKAKDKSGRNKVIYTRIVDKELFISNKNSISNCPFVLQEAINKDFDVRVTVVGTKTFAVSIRTSAGAGDPNFLDWRRLNAKRYYAAHTLPKSLAHRCVQLTQELGLHFGCLDFGYSRERGYVFFEINPQGQWTPSEILAGHPISFTLAKFLAKCK